MTSGKKSAIAPSNSEQECLDLQSIEWVKTREIFKGFLWTRKVLSMAMGSLKRIHNLEKQQTS